MKAVINNFRGSRRRKSEHQMVIMIEGVDKEAAKAIIGKTVSWTAKGKKKTTIKGKISALHGNKGAVRAIFEKGMPGQSLGAQVDVQ